jgi:hypothetical protein
VSGFYDFFAYGRFCIDCAKKKVSNDLCKKIKKKQTKKREITGAISLYINGKSSTIPVKKYASFA